MALARARVTKLEAAMLAVGEDPTRPGGDIEAGMFASNEAL